MEMLERFDVLQSKKLLPVMRWYIYFSVPRSNILGCVDATRGVSRPGSQLHLPRSAASADQINNLEQIEGCLPKLPICQIWIFSAFGIKVLYMSLSSTDYCCFVIKINI